MDVATVIRRIKRQFGDEYDVVVLDDDVYGWIYEAEMDIIRNTGTNEQTMTQSSTLFPLAVPTNVNIIRVSIDGTALTYLPPNVIQDQGFNEDAQGAYSSWYKVNTTLYLYPTDTLVVNVNIDYTKIPTIMQGPAETNVFTVPEKYRTDVIQFCLARAHNKNRNFQAERVHMENYDRSLGLRREEAYAIDGAVYKGVDPMDFDNEFWYD